MRYFASITGIILLIMAYANLMHAQTVKQDFQTRYSAGLTFKASEKIRIRFSPEIRFNDNFSVDNYFLDLQGSYKAFKFLSLGTGYRFVINEREIRNTEYLHRWAFYARFEHKLDRFKFQLKPSYTNFNDDLSFDKFFRIRLQSKYNVPKIPLFVVGGAEAFRQVKLDQLSKMRYYGGLDYKLNKHHVLALRYKFDYYLQAYYNKHIFTFAYTYKF